MKPHWTHLGHGLLAGTLGLSAIALFAAGSKDSSSILHTAPLPADPPAEDEIAAELDRRFTQDVGPLLNTYCFSCHAGEDPSADLAFDTIRNFKDTLTGDLDLRLVKELLDSGAMPPANKPRPTDHERLIITQWIDGALAYVPPDAPIDPGWFTIHRLNRHEYRNTLRDLLGVDPSKVDLAQRLPRDDTGYGFDNVADVLSTSPLAIEEYLAAAERAVETALGPVLTIGDHAHALRPLEGGNGQGLSRGGFLLYSNGPVSAKYTAPATGEYLVRFSAWETKAGDEHSRIDLRVGRKKIEEFVVSGTRDKPQEFEHRVQMNKGSHTISLNFLNDYYVKDQADRNLAIETLSVAGPLDEATTERPRQWTRIFAHAASITDETERSKAILEKFASRAYRRPATEQQVESLLRVYEAERASGAEFEPAVRVALSASLVSPNFLFRSVAHPAAADPESRYSLDGYELASRLSYFLWSSMPDGPLLAAAADGSLLTSERLAAEVRRMLADKRASAFVESFSGQWLQLRGLDAVSIDRTRFPDYDDRLRDDMTTEATLFVADVLSSDRSILEFIDSDATFLNERLAKHYGVPGVEGKDFRRVELPPDSPRGGILTMGAVLTLTSNTTRTSPVKRGLFVLDQILGAPPPPPPADIPPLEQAVHAKENATVREQLAAHVANPSCAACHVRLDPIGLTFENFDAIGRWRDIENGLPIDSSGTLPGGVELRGSSDLKHTLLARSDEFVEALTAKLLTYALGRGVEPFDRPAVRQIAQRTRAEGDRFTTLIESVVLSETFRTCRGRKPAP